MDWRHQLLDASLLSAFLSPTELALLARACRIVPLEAGQRLLEWKSVHKLHFERGKQKEVQRFFETYPEILPADWYSGGRRGFKAREEWATCRRTCR